MASVGFRQRSNYWAPVYLAVDTRKLPQRETRSDEEPGELRLVANHFQRLHRTDLSRLSRQHDHVLADVAQNYRLGRLRLSTGTEIQSRVPAGTSRR
jgi:hypothetical protein